METSVWLQRQIWCRILGEAECVDDRFQTALITFQRPSPLAIKSLLDPLHLAQKPQLGATMPLSTCSTYFYTWTCLRDCEDLVFRFFHCLHFPTCPGHSLCFMDFGRIPSGFWTTAVDPPLVIVNLNLFTYTFSFFLLMVVDIVVFRMTPEPV